MSEGAGRGLSVTCQPHSTLHVNMFFFRLSRTQKNFLLNPSGFWLQTTDTYAKGMFWKDSGVHSINGELAQKVGSKGILETGQQHLYGYDCCHHSH